MHNNVEPANTNESSQADNPQDLMPNLWGAFTSARSEGEYYQSWLSLQSDSIVGAIQSLLIVRTEGEQFTPVAQWPELGVDPSTLSDVIERVLDEHCGLLTELATANQYAVAYPVLIDEQLQGVIAFEVSVTEESELQSIMEKLQWGTAWLELLVRRKQVDDNQALLHRLKTSVDMLAITLSKENFEAAATAFTTELAAVTNCERISLGFSYGRRLKLQAVSHSSEVGRKMNLTRGIERVMDEAIVQRREIVYPVPDDEVLINREHEALSRQQSMASIATFPLYGKGRYYGALTCERAADQPFVQEDVEFFRAVASLVGPAMEEKYANDRPLPAKIQQAGQRQLERLFGKGYIARKLLLLVVTVAILFFIFAKGDYRLAADVSMEGAVRRAVVVPFPGFIDEAPARAGDLVEKGQLLCALDNRDLRLVSLSKHSGHRQLQRQYQEAVAKHDRPQSKIIEAQLDQSQAELDLITAKINRTKLTAPFAGLLVSGDLSQRLGSSVEQGEILFEVTPLNAYRVILKVDERRIRDVKLGQEGALVLSSLPGKQYKFTVSKITPISRAEEGRTYFRVEAQLDSIDMSLRPGMEGVGKINIDQRKLFTLWTRDMFDWLQLSFWSWFS